MKLISCLTSKFFLIVLILSIVKEIIVYSVGRSHGGEKFDWYMPSLMEWLTIIVLITVLYIIGSVVMVFTFKSDIYKLEKELELL